MSELVFPILFSVCTLILCCMITRTVSRRRRTRRLEAELEDVLTLCRAENLEEAEDS